MSKRPASHRLETASINALQRRMPLSWVYRDEHPDYGIDGSIEIFTPEDDPTGLRCLVQLKCTAKGSRRPSVRLRTETGEYYRSQDLPVLIALYEADRDRLLVRWFHEFDPYYGGLGEKWITFAFGEDHIWSDATPARIEADLLALRVLRRGSLPLQIPVEISVRPGGAGGIPASRVLAEIRRELRGLRSIFKEDAANSTLWIQVDHEKTVASFRGRRSISLHYPGETLDAGSYAKDLLLLISILIGATGDHSLAATLAGRVAGTSKLMRNPEVASSVGASMVRSRQIPLLLDVADQLLDDEASHATADTLMVMATVPDVDGKRNAAFVVEHLRRRIQRAESTRDSARLGVAHYNLANQLRGQGHYREALRHYRRAARVHPPYAERDYYCKEIGGLLFGAGFYSASARFYREATGRGGPRSWDPLYADALMFAGAFDEAREVFAAYLRSEPHPDAQWILKHGALEAFARFGCSAYGRRSREAVRTMAAEPVPGARAAMQALALDPLCVDAWVRLAESEDSDFDLEYRARALIIAAVIELYEPKLWAAAFLHGAAILEYGEMEKQVAFAALHAVGSEFTACVREYAEFLGMSGEELDQMAEALEAIEQEYDKIQKPNTFDVRVAGADSSYDTVTLLLGEPPAGPLTEE